MNIYKGAIIALMLFAVSACSAPKLEMQPGQQVGAYKITNVDLDKNPDSNVTNEELTYIRQQVINKLVPLLTFRGHGQHARLNITLTSANIDPTALYTLALGGGSHIRADIVIYDQTGRKKIANQMVYTTANIHSGGVTGIILNNTIIDNKDDITTAFAQDIINLLYPQPE